MSTVVPTPAWGRDGHAGAEACCSGLMSSHESAARGRLSPQLSYPPSSRGSEEREELGVDGSGPVAPVGPAGFTSWTPP